MVFHVRLHVHFWLHLNVLVKSQNIGHGCHNNDGVTAETNIILIVLSDSQQVRIVKKIEKFYKNISLYKNSREQA